MINNACRSLLLRILSIGWRKCREVGQLYLLHHLGWIRSCCPRRNQLVQRRSWHMDWLLPHRSSKSWDLQRHRSWELPTRRTVCTWTQSQLCQIDWSRKEQMQILPSRCVGLVAGLDWYPDPSCNRATRSRWMTQIWVPRPQGHAFHNDTCELDQTPIQVLERFLEVVRQCVELLLCLHLPGRLGQTDHLEELLLQMYRYLELNMAFAEFELRKCCWSSLPVGRRVDFSVILSRFFWGANGQLYDYRADLRLYSNFSLHLTYWRCLNVVFCPKEHSFDALYATTWRHQSAHWRSNLW